MDRVHAYARVLQTAPPPSRYDVKYGSAGFDTFGYRAGCEFAAGTAADAALAPAAQPNLCTAAQRGRRQCTPDHSAVGFCESRSNGDDLYLVFTVRPPCRSALKFPKIPGQHGSEDIEFVV